MPIAGPARADGTPARSSRPFLDYSLSALADAGYTDVCLVVAPDHEAMAQHYAGPGAPRRLRLAFAVQDEPHRHRERRRRRRRRGPATTRSSSSTATTTMLCGPWRRSSAAPAPPPRSIRRETLVARSNIPAERIRAFALGVVDDGRLARIVEKPTPAQAAALGGRARQHDLLADAAGDPRRRAGASTRSARGELRAGRRGERAHRRRRPLRGGRRRRTACSICRGEATSPPSSGRWRGVTVDP